MAGRVLWCSCLGAVRMETMRKAASGPRKKVLSHRQGVCIAQVIQAIYGPCGGSIWVYGQGEKKGPRGIIAGKGRERFTVLRCGGRRHTCWPCTSECRPPACTGSAWRFLEGPRRAIGLWFARRLERGPQVPPLLQSISVAQTAFQAWCKLLVGVPEKKGPWKTFPFLTAKKARFSAT